MSSNMSSAEEYLRRTTDWMTTISLFALLFIGPFGCLCNILIFTSKQLTKSSCAFYFRCTAIFEFCILCFGGISRLASEHFGKNLLNENQIYCKFRSYLITAMGTIATYFILLAAVDRCMITSVHIRYRAFGQIKIAYRMSLGIILIGMIVTIHAYVYFDLRPLCTPQPGVYSIFYSVYITVLASILPDGLILIFTLWTLINAQHVRKRLSTTQLANTRQQRHVQKTEAHLLIMMISQALITVLLDIPRVSCYSYYFLTANTPKSSYQTLVNIFIFQFSNILLYMNYSKSFYVYTLASGLFRKIGRTRITHFYRKASGFTRNSRIHPNTDVHQH